jgi:predicted DNA-binding transcriptional regulator AlpA
VSKVPQHIVETINTLLTPYGESYTPGEATSGNGYVNWNGAVKYTGLSKSTLVRMVKLGKLKPPHKVGTGKNGAALFAKSDLDNFIQSA